MDKKLELLNKIHDNINEYCDTYFDFAFKPESPAVHLHEPTTSGAEIFAAVETMLSTYTTMGKKVRAFEQQYADYCGMKYGIMTNSGSSNNLLSIAALANPVTRNQL